MTPARQAHLRFIRRHVPEPSQCEDPVIVFRWPDETDWSKAFADPEDFDWSILSPDTGELRKKLFCIRRMKFVAWTYDGVNPLFPEYEDKD